MAKKEFPVSVDQLTEDATHAYDILESESDRGVPLVAVAFIDSMLTALLRSRFVDDAEVVERLLGRGRPLDNFSAKIDIAYCLGLMNRHAHSDLHQMRDIRNKFAHAYSPATFADPWVQDKCEAFDATVRLPVTPITDRTTLARKRFKYAWAIHFGALLATVRK